ncbi:MAG TPA: glycosyltransferase family 4 protein [Opitutaceae bacterium]|nr:glycosyltransferase family 4 protein [Opitutaceae bacterium]
MLDPAELAGAYHGLDAFCYPTVAERGEAQPMAVLEAMAAGLPVIASDLACFADHLRHDHNALVVPPGDAAALAAALARLIADPELGRRLGAAALQRVQALDDARIVDQHLADYEALLDAASR